MTARDDEREAVMQGSEVAAFDLWLKRGLADVHGAVMQEPVPDELLRLLDSAPSES